MKILKFLICNLCMLVALGCYPFQSTMASEQSNEKVIETKYGEVFEKGTINKIELIGTKKADSPYIQNIKILVKDAKSDKIINTIKPKTNSGYSPSIIVEDFTKDNLKDIFLIMDSGGSGGFTFSYLYSGKDNKINTIFDYEKWQNNYIAKYQDGYKVLVTNKKTCKKYIIDISLRSKDYLSQIYDKNGKLLKPKQAYVSDVNIVFPYYNNAQNIYQLQVNQSITGLYNADKLGYVISNVDFTNGKMDVYYVMVGMV